MAEFSGIVEGLDDDLAGLADSFSCLFPTIGPAVDERADVSTFNAHFALATVPLLNDDLTGLLLMIFLDDAGTSSSTLPTVSDVDDTLGGEVDVVEVSALEVVVRLRAMLLLRDAFTVGVVFVVGAVARRFAVRAVLCSLAFWWSFVAVAALTTEVIVMGVFFEVPPLPPTFVSLLLSP
jgi:hypothetical protein